MFCSSCGEQVQEGKKFCPECGTEIGTAIKLSGPLNYGIAGRIIVIIGGILVITGSLLPWTTASNIFNSYEYSGIEGDGEISVVLGIIMIAAALFRFNRPGSRALIAVFFAVLAFSFGLIELSAVSEDVNEVKNLNPLVDASVGLGIYLIIIGGVLGLAGILPNSKQR